MALPTPDPSLFAPSLQTDASVRRPNYSQRAHYVTSFFGGPVAAVLFGMIGARQIGRLRSDLLFHVAVAAVAVGTTVAIVLLSPSSEVAPLSDREDFSRSLWTVGYRVVGMLFGLAYILRYRAHDLAVDVAGIERPNPWVPGLASFALGLAFMFSIVELLRP